MPLSLSSLIFLPILTICVIIQALFSLLIHNKKYIRMQRNNGSPACASCRHQRKRCTDKCLLAPFFPVEKNQDFQAVLKVFGVSNVTKLVKSIVQEDDRTRAVDSLVWEATCRLKDRVLGSYGEYRKVCDELKFYRNLYQHMHQLPNQMGARLYKTAPLIGWNVGAGNNNNYIHNNENSIDSFPYNYSAHQVNLENVRQDRENGSLNSPQQHAISGYYLTGQLGPADAKPMETTLWSGNS